jgi:hypothetical protein
MAGSGPGIGGWTSGAGLFTRAMERRDIFTTNHPEWTIKHISDTNSYEATQGDTDTVLIVLHDRSLDRLMERLEAEFDFPAET